MFRTRTLFWSLSLLLVTSAKSCIECKQRNFIVELKPCQVIPGHVEQILIQKSSKQELISVSPGSSDNPPEDIQDFLSFFGYVATRKSCAQNRMSKRLIFIDNLLLFTTRIACEDDFITLHFIAQRTLGIRCVSIAFESSFTVGWQYLNMSNGAFFHPNQVYQLIFQESFYFSLSRRNKSQNNGSYFLFEASNRLGKSQDRSCRSQCLLRLEQFIGHVGAFYSKDRTNRTKQVETGHLIAVGFICMAVAALVFVKLFSMVRIAGEDEWCSLSHSIWLKMKA